MGPHAAKLLFAGWSSVKALTAGVCTGPLARCWESPLLESCLSLTKLWCQATGSSTRRTVYPTICTVEGGRQVGLPSMVSQTNAYPIFFWFPGQSYTFLISSDYERAEWRENIREQQKKCEYPWGGHWYKYYEFIREQEARGYEVWAFIWLLSK